MRIISLEDLYSELHEISNGDDANPRLNMILDAMKMDLNREARISDQELELNKWWDRYRGLSTYIYK